MSLLRAMGTETLGARQYHLRALPGSRVDGEGCRHGANPPLHPEFLQIVTRGCHSDYVGNLNLFANLIKHLMKIPVLLYSIILNTVSFFKGRHNISNDYRENTLLGLVNKGADVIGLMVILHGLWP